MSTWDSNDLELEPSQVYKKIKVVKNPADLVGWPGKTRSKTWLQLVNYFLFFIKTTSFWFIKKIKVDPGDPVKTHNPSFISSQSQDRV